MDINGYTSGDWAISRWLKENPTSDETLKTILEKYKHIQNWNDSLLPVSTIPRFDIRNDRSERLAYHHDLRDYAGIWGFIDEQGIEVIPCQYIFTTGFHNGFATVCKGKWEQKREYDTKYCKNGWWTDEELWGQINTKGKVIIPLIFDEIMWDFEDLGFLAVHYGGWESGKWGVVDMQGNWLVEPIFEDLDYWPCNEDTFAFYIADKWSDPDHVPMGLYSLKEKKVLIEPKYWEIDLADDGVNYKVELFDTDKGEIDRMIIDRNDNFISNIPQGETK